MAENNNIIWSNELTRELHKTARRKFRRRKVITHAVDSIWAADLLDLQRYAKTNKNYNYLLMVIDTFSKYGWVIPLKNKSGSTVANAFEQLFLENGGVPNKLWTDKGTEFFNRNVDRVLKTNGVTLYTTENEEKSCIVERWIRTFMKKLYTYFDTNRHTEYLKILPVLVSKYNNTKHRSIGCTPEEARDPYNYQTVFDTLYPEQKNPKKVLKNRKAVFSVGDNVRLSVVKDKFEKGYFPNWTEQLYVIDGINLTDPITYKVKSLNGEEIKGSFYKEQLQKSNQTVFRIEKTIGKVRMRNGIREIRVKWSGYGNEFNEWIPEKDVV